jgi:uncharacterized SAM-binding protein YcdF (DUF218 family)
MSWFLTNLFSAFLLPPLNLLLIGVAGLLITRSRPRAGRILIKSSLILLWLCSTPYVSDGAIQLLENQTRVVDLKSEPADAIVVLGGGTYFHAPEFNGEDTVKSQTLVRLRYAAQLHRETGKPILVTGGKPLGNQSSEGQQMKLTLEQDFHVPVQWAEEDSNNTFENAKYSYPLLHKAGIKRIYLVTHAWHMPRSVMAFQSAGFEVIPAPLAFTTRYKTDLLSFIPNAESLNTSEIFMHELIGLVWYRLKS